MRTAAPDGHVPVAIVKDARRSNSVTNTIAILEIVAEYGVGITAKEIAQRLDMAPATVYRLLNSLVAEEFLIRTADLRGFGLGMRLRGLAEALNTPTVPTAARRCLAEFRDSTRFAVTLMHFGHSTVRVIDQDPDHPVTVERQLSKHLHASAAGKLLLSSRTQWRLLIPAPARLTTRTLVDHGSLSADIETIRGSGYARAADELVPGLTCLAYPVHNESGSITGALCLTGPSNRLDTLESHSKPARNYAALIGPLLY
ncbi:DNA-binding IclR family transcriptional regulator [Nocardia sp. GAS34]